MHPQNVAAKKRPSFKRKAAFFFHEAATALTQPRAAAWSLSGYFFFGSPFLGSCFFGGFFGIGLPHPQVSHMTFTPFRIITRPSSSM
jgi:hypothetical protein